ncbi:hypothetical protein ACHAXR_012874 [Thalassiosira sp. AJA248-18]
MADTAQSAQGARKGSNIATESDAYDDYLMEYVAEVKAAAAASESEQHGSDDNYNYCNNSLPLPHPPVLPTASSGTATRPRSGVLGGEADVAASLMTLKHSFNHGGGSDGSGASSSSSQLAGLKQKSDSEQEDWREEENDQEEAEEYPANNCIALHNIKQPGINDCLFGRGGGTNHHPGNMLFRKMVAEKRHIYQESDRHTKPHIAMEIVNAWRAFNGRFLMMDPDTKLWYDVGDDKARVKTKSTLREKEVFLPKKKKQKTEG